MKRLSALAFLGAAVTGAGACREAGTPRTGPVVEIRAVRTVQAEAMGTLAATYRIANRGDADLTLFPHPARCEDVDLDLPRNVIAPGETVSARLQASPQGEAGQVRRTVGLMTNDPSRPLVRLEAEARVDRDWSASPPALFVGPVRAGEPLRLEIALRGPAAGLPVIQIPADAPLTAAVEAPALPDHTARVTFRSRPDAPAGPFRTEIAVAPSAGVEPSLVVPVAGRIVPEVVADPAQIEFEDSGAEAAFLLVGGKRPFRVLDVRAGSREWRVTPLQGANRQRVQIAAGPELAPQGTIQVRLSAGRNLLLEIPFRVRGAQ